MEKTKPKVQQGDSQKMQTEKDKMLNGELYNASDLELKKERLNARRLTRLYNQTLETGVVGRDAGDEQPGGSR